MNNQRKKNALAIAALHLGPKGIGRNVRSLSRNLRGNASLISLNAVGKDGKTSLMYSANIGDIYTVRQLLDQGVNSNLQDEQGMSALMYAARGKHLPCIQALLQAGADPNLAAHLPPEADFQGERAQLQGYTAIVFAGIRGDASIVAALEQAGASLILPNGTTVITAACLTGREIERSDIATLDALLRAGIRVQPMDVQEAFQGNFDDGGGGSPYQALFETNLMKGLIRQNPNRAARLAIITASGLPYGQPQYAILNDTVDNPEAVLNHVEPGFHNLPHNMLGGRRKPKRTRRAKRGSRRR
jgi:hypothetical protein